MVKEGYHGGGISPELQKELDEWKIEERRRKERWYDHHKERHPSYSPTNEEGDFVGVFGYATTVGVRKFPFYKTESGTYFYEWENSNREKDDRGKKVVKIDIEKALHDGLTRFYTRKSFLGDEPVAEPGMFPYQGATPLSTLDK